MRRRDRRSGGARATAPVRRARSKYPATAAEIRALLERAGFVPRTLEIRIFTTVFPDVAQIIEFLEATTYGDLVPAASAADYAALAGTLEALFAGEYADRVSTDGIRLERYVLLAVQTRPADVVISSP